MNKKIVIIITTIFTVLLLSLMGTLIYSFATESQVTTRESRSANDQIVTSPSIASGQPDPATYGYRTNTGDIETTSDIVNSYSIPVLAGFNIYCIEPGAGLPKSWADLAFDVVFDLAAQDPVHYLHGCPAGTFAGLTTGTYYRPKETRILPPAAAYIVSDENGDWTQQQKGIWNLRDFGIDGGLIIGSGNSAHDGPSTYDVPVNNYVDFDNKVRNNGMQPNNNTNLDNVYTKVNQSAKEYTVGPFSIDYVNGIYGNTAFGGISNMVVYGYNKEGQQVRTNIAVKALILNGSRVTPQYFNPDGTTKIDTSSQVYPSPNQEFQIVFDDPNAGLSANDPNRVAYISIKVEFKYMLADGKYTRLEGVSYEVGDSHVENGHCDGHTVVEQVGVDEVTGEPIYSSHTEYRNDDCCFDCWLDYYLIEHPEQDLMSADAIRTIYEQEIQIYVNLKIDTSMDLGGHVWEDTLATKESKADGVSNTSGDVDVPLKNVKVTLYTSDGKIATLLSNENESGISEEKLMHRINPTYTDANGNYLFEGLDPMKDYYVTFEYNGQVYMPTEYLNTANTQYSSVSQMVNAGLYNTTSWNISSKGTEAIDNIIPGVEISRNNYDKRYGEIGSYPENYTSSNSLGVVGTKNAVYTQLDLMGYTLNENGQYTQTGTQLIDGYTYDSRGLQTDTYSEGVISKAVRDYIKQNKKYPDDSAMRSIYQNIAGNNQEIWRMLQFIEDCYIQAYTGSPSTQNRDLYPVYDQFIINHADGNAEYETAEQAQNGSYNQNSVTIAGVTYRPIYSGQFYVNLGLWRRQEFDASLRKDVYKATLKINDKTVIYNYDKRNANSDDGTNSGNGADNNTYWDINVRMSDYAGYYGMTYNREIYETDYLFGTPGGIAEDHPGNPLEVYITYKLTIRNQSMSIMGQIKEVVDYYDKDYTYREDLSWVTYDNNSVSDDEYYNAMVQEDISLIENAKDVNSSNSSKYGASTQSDIVGNQYNAVYINGLQDKKLATGESAYIYLTFQVNKENDRVILDGGSYATSDTSKENLAEINGYATYYRDGTTLPNAGLSSNYYNKNSSNIAGLLDRDSNPGNLESADLQGDRYEQNFEDDTDRAPSLRVIIDEDAIRRANGIVWEDERTETVGNAEDSADAIIGDGIRQDDEIGIQGVTVQFVEKCVDGSEYIWFETTTDNNGKYEFAEYIPGNYVIRFYYGDTEATALSGENGGSNVVSYNGQDFKSTTYQDGITQNETTDNSGVYSGYIDTASQNESGTFGYDIYASDSNSTNYSDAKDIWSINNRQNLNIIGPVQSAREVQGRDSVIAYSDDNITNHIAEVLASPYSGDSSLYNELMDNTYMTAETGVIVVEFEYDRQQTDGLNSTQNNASNSSRDYIGDNQYNSNYTLNNIDLGLTERPKAQLEIDKSVANVKVTLANGTILFDINEAANNALWQDHQEYSIDEEKMNSEDRDIDFENGEIGMYEEYYYKVGENNRDNLHRYSYRDEIDNIVRDTDKGLIQLTMDQELMHGATIQVTYTVKITNVGEVDYVDGDSKNFYYKGDTTNASIVTTTANQVVDYVANNLQFDSNNATNIEDGWSVMTDENLVANDLVNSRLTEQLTNFNTIIQTEDFGNGDEDGEALVPGQEISKTLILSQLITPENTDDDLTYSNMVEIVKTSNTVGRRMAYSVVGNQDPTLSDASEVDSSVAERIVILPPFGSGEILTYCAIAVAVGAILVIGIVLIRRKVLSGKNK